MAHAIDRIDALSDGMRDTEAMRLEAARARNGLGMCLQFSWRSRESVGAHREAVAILDHDAPTEEEEFVIVGRVTGVAHAVASVATTDQLLALQKECRMSYVDPSLIQYAVKLAAATRDPERYEIPDVAKYLQFGASPRAPIHLIEGARALAYLRGRSYVLPEDVTDLVNDVFRHRLVLSYEALSDGVTADQIMQRAMSHIAAPEKPLETHVKVPANV